MRAIVSAILSQQGVAPPPAGGITYVGGDVDSLGTITSATDLTLNFTCAEDDVGIAFASGDQDTHFFTITAGWTLIERRSNSNGRDGDSSSWYRVLDGTETSIDISTSASEERSAEVLIFRGVDTTTPLDVTPPAAKFQANDTAGSNPAITTVTDNCAVVLLEHTSHDYITTHALPTTPSGLVLGPSTLESYANSCTAYDLDVGTAGTITPSAWTHTITSTAAETLRHTIALRPA